MSDLIDDLLDYADTSFRLEQPVQSTDGPTKSKASAAAHLRQLAKTKKLDPDHFIKEQFDEAPTEPPYELQWIFEVFKELANRRGGNGYGPNPITQPEIESWQHNYGVSLDPWEVKLLCDLDNVWLSAHYGSSSTHAKRKQRAGSAGDPEPKQVLGSRRNSGSSSD